MSVNIIKCKYECKKPGESADFLTSLVKIIIVLLYKILQNSSKASAKIFEGHLSPSSLLLENVSNLKSSKFSVCFKNA